MKNPIIESKTGHGDIKAGSRQQNTPLQPLLLTYQQLVELGISFSKEHIRIMENDGLFPRRIRLSPKRVAWDRQEIIDWLQIRAKARPCSAKLY